jgi:hypothetical protein
MSLKEICISFSKRTLVMEESIYDLKLSDRTLRFYVTACLLYGRILVCLRQETGPSSATRSGRYKARRGRHHFYRFMLSRWILYFI